MPAIYDLYDTIPTYGYFEPAYAEKMLHRIPKTKAVDRVTYLLKAARDKVIFDFGATGPLSVLLQKEVKEYHGTDILPSKRIENYYQIDLDKAQSLPDIPGLELIIAGEVIEHLSNAGHFLDLLHGCGAPVILTTPNCYSSAGRQHLKHNIENVNREHVAWYSYHTLKVLVTRHKFTINEWFWYNGKPLTAEGLIFKMEPV